MWKNIKNTILVSKTIGKRQRGRYHGVKIGLALGVLISISMLVLAGCPATSNPVQQIIRGGPDPVTPDPDPDPDPPLDPGEFTRDSDNLQPTDLAVAVQLSSAEVSQGESVQITATVTNTSDHASNGHALLVFYESADAIVNPALLDVDLGYTISDNAIRAIEEALREGYGLDPLLSAPLREQDLNEQESVDANRKSVVDSALDPIFASVVVAPLVSGGTFSPSAINIPDTVDIGSAYYGACVVLDRFSCQSAELKVTTGQKPDLRAVDAPRFTNAPSIGYYTSGASVTATGMARNAGGVAATDVTVALYRVVNDGDDTKVGDAQTIASIAAGSTASVTFTFQLANNYPTGTHTEQYYFQIAEVANELDAENNRSDNNSLLVYVTNGDNFVDSDGDRLIDIRNLDMLNNIRHNLAGDSYKSSAGATGIQCGAAANQACIGYELMRSLDFTSVSSYGDEGYWNHADWRPNNNSDLAKATNAGWPPIGGTFSAIFEGNGNTIRNLYSRNLGTPGAAYGLFSQVSGTVRNLTVEDSAIYGSNYTDYIGTVVGYLQANGKVINASARRGVIDSGNAKYTKTIFANLGHNENGRYYVDNPRITGGMDIAGGLVGANAGTIAASSAAIAVIGSYGGAIVALNNNWAFADKLGGLVGDNTPTGNIIASYSLSAVIGDGAHPTSTSSDRIGGIAGTNYGEILSSYSLSNLNGQGQYDYIGGITGGLGYPPTVNPSPDNDNPVVFSTYSTSTMYGTGVEEFFNHRGGREANSGHDWNCVGPITGFNHFDRTNIHHSYFFGKIGQTNQQSNCPKSNDHRTNLGIDQLIGMNTGWATASSTDNGVSSRAWMYGGGRAAPALRYNNYANHDGADDNSKSYAGIDYCDHIGKSSCRGLLPGQPLTDQGNTMGAAYSIDTPFYPGGGLSIPAKIDSAGDVDYFKITVVQAGEISIESSRSQGVNMQVQLLNSRGDLVEYDDDDGDRNNFRIYRYIPRGEYIIRAYAREGDIGSYMIGMQMTGQGNLQACGVTGGGVFRPHGDDTTFRFSIRYGCN